MSFLDEALKLVDLGFEVFPLGERSKLPWAKSRGFLAATLDKAKVVAWWTERPLANVAIRPAGFVLDVDDRGPGTGPATWAAIAAEHEPLPPTWTASSGRGEGRHYHFALPAGHPGVRGWVTPVLHLDVKSHSTGYVVAPPSIHDTGSVYRWVAGHAPWECPLAEAPAWLLAMLRPVGEDAPTRSAAKASPGARKATDEERAAFLRAVQAAAQGTTPAAREMRHILEGAVVAEPGTRDLTWTRLTYRLCTMAVYLELGDALDDLVGGLVSASLEAEGRAAPGGVTLDSALDKCARALPRVEAEVARARASDAVMREVLTGLQSPRGVEALSMEEKLAQVRAQLTPEELQAFEAVMEDPFNWNSYPLKTGAKGGWALRVAMSLRGWFVLATPQSKELEVCHPYPDGTPDLHGSFFASYTSGLFRQALPTRVVEGDKKPELLSVDFLRSARRKNRVVFEEHNEDPNAVNLYRGISATPKEGDVSPWVKLLDYVTSGIDTDWLEKWLAWKLQNPLKPTGSVVFLCGQEGTGKSRLVELYSGFFAPHVLSNGNAATFAKFNSALEGRLLVCLDDIGELSVEEVDKLKHLATARIIETESKFQPLRSTTNHIAFIGTCNGNPLRRARGVGRRWGLFDTRDEELGEGWYRGEWEPWLRGGGADAVAWRLMHIDVSRFNPLKRQVSIRLEENRLTALTGGEAFLADVAEGLHETAREGGPMSELGLDPTIPTVGVEYTLAQWMHMYQLWSRSARKGDCTVRELSQALKWGGQTVRKTNGRQVARLDIDKLTSVIERVRKTGK